jgi:hypothetical protein
MSNRFEYTMRGEAGFYNLSRWLEAARTYQRSRQEHRLIQYTNARGEAGVLVTPQGRLNERIAGELQAAPCKLQWIVDKLGAAEVAPVVDEAGNYLQSRLYHEAWAGLLWIALEAQKQGKAAAVGGFGTGGGAPQVWAYTLMSLAVDPAADPTIILQAIKGAL